MKKERDEESGWRLMWCLHPDYKPEPGKRRKFLIGECKLDKASRTKVLRGQSAVNKNFKVGDELPEGAWKISEDKAKGTVKYIVPEGNWVRWREVGSNFWTNSCAEEYLTKKAEEALALTRDYDLNKKNCLKFFKAAKAKYDEAHKEEEEEIDT